MDDHRFPFQIDNSDQQQQQPGIQNMAMPSGAHQRPPVAIVQPHQDNTQDFQAPNQPDGSFQSHPLMPQAPNAPYNIQNPTNFRPAQPPNLPHMPPPSQMSTASTNSLPYLVHTDWSTVPPLSQRDYTHGYYQAPNQLDGSFQPQSMIPHAPYNIQNPTNFDPVQPPNLPHILQILPAPSQSMTSGVYQRRLVTIVKQEQDHAYDYQAAPNQPDGSFQSHPLMPHASPAPYNIQNPTNFRPVQPPNLPHMPPPSQVSTASTTSLPYLVHTDWSTVSPPRQSGAAFTSFAGSSNTMAHQRMTRTTSAPNTPTHQATLVPYNQTQNAGLGQSNDALYPNQPPHQQLATSSEDTTHQVGGVSRPRSLRYDRFLDMDINEKFRTMTSFSQHQQQQSHSFVARQQSGHPGSSSASHTRPSVSGSTSPAPQQQQQNVNPQSKPLKRRQEPIQKPKRRKLSTGSSPQTIHERQETRSSVHMKRKVRRVSGQTLQSYEEFLNMDIKQQLILMESFHQHQQNPNSSGQQKQLSDKPGSSSSSVSQLSTWSQIQALASNTNTPSLMEQKQMLLNRIEQQREKQRERGENSNTSRERSDTDDPDVALLQRLLREVGGSQLEEPNQSSTAAPAPDRPGTSAAAAPEPGASATTDVDRETQPTEADSASNRRRMNSSEADASSALVTMDLHENTPHNNDD